MASERLRAPFLWLGLLCIVTVVLLEGGSTVLLTSTSSDAASTTQHQLGIPTLWLFDISLAWAILLAALQQVVDKNVIARTQGVVTLVLSIVVIFAGIAALIKAFVLLMVMLAMIGTFFGIIAYLAIFGHFDTGSAATILDTLTFFKVGLVVMLLLAQQNFLRGKGLVLMLVVSLVLDLVLSFLHGFVPGILVSITDAVGAIVIAIVAIVYAIVQLVFAIIAVVRGIIGLKRGSQSSYHT